jgi:hypothetical protein
MNVLIIFGFGIVVFAMFVAGVFFDSKKSVDDEKKSLQEDTLDYDGSGNYGRIPDKKSSNRAN